MKLHLEKSVLIWFFITAIVLAVLGVYSFTSTQRLIDTARLLSHATRVINNAEQAVKAIVDIETGQRGYVITGNEEFLEPFYESSKKIDRYLTTLDSLTKGHAMQQTRMVELHAYINYQVKWTQKVIAERKLSFERAQALIASGEGKRTTDAIRSIVKNIQEEERKIFQRQNTISGKSLQQFQYSFIGLAVTITLIIIYLFYAINKNLYARNRVERRLKKVADENRDLYDNAPCGYFSVNEQIVITEINETLLNWTGHRRQDVIDKMKFEDMLAHNTRAEFLETFARDFEQYKRDGYAKDLEFEFLRRNGTTFPVIVSSLLVFDSNGEFKGSRTTVSDNTERKKVEDKVKLLNQELEAFTYSVSHDLRAPLRSITGYTQILKEDYSDKLDDEGRRVTQIIINNARRMGQLIDDLLDFSRLGRKELSHANVNMEAMVQDIVREQIALEPERQVNVKILPLRSSKGDNSMIRQVWINLVSNALKYSRNRKVTEIEIGSTDKDGQTCYYVRDNGAGFDMLYVDKLFGVFQRLHKINEFEGTGVGLALVKTIIKRHGGYVWAEGKVDVGATFYFSLPVEEQLEV